MNDSRLPTPDSRLPTPDSRFPTPDSRLPTPDSALIIVRDIGAFWQDCGCQGEAIGGVGRLLATAHGAKEVVFLFVGRTVLPGSEGTGRDSRVLPHGVPYFAALGLRVFQSLEKVIWVPDAAERELLSGDEYADLLKFGTAVESLTWNGLAVKASGSTLTIGSEKLNMPSAGSRARDVGALLLWKRENPGQPQFSRRLSASASIRTRNELAARQADEVLAGAATPLISYWVAPITAELHLDNAVDKVASDSRVAMAHIGSQSDGAYLPDTGHADTVRAQYQACGRCHESAFKAWRESRHSHSMGTLRAKMKHTDLRCLPCHTAKFEAGAKGGTATKGHDAVTCTSCHVKGRDAATVCLDCHTALADPKAHYLRAVKSICTTSKDYQSPSGAEPCGRER